VSADKSKKVSDAFGRWARSARRNVVVDVPGEAKHRFSDQLRAEFKRAQAGETREVEAERLKRELQG
jgi:hypothetical protein